MGGTSRSGCSLPRIPLFDVGEGGGGVGFDFNTTLEAKDRPNNVSHVTRP